MDTEFINRIKGYAALFMAVMAVNPRPVVKIYLIML